MTEQQAITPGEALAMDDNEFEELLRSQLNREGRDHEAFLALTSPDVYVRTDTMLRLMINQSKGVASNKFDQMEDAKGTPDFKERQRSWRATRRYLNHLIELASDCRYHSLQQRRQLRALRQAVARPHPSTGARPARNEEGVRRTLPALRRLTTALLNHETEMSDEPSEVDEELWDLLDELTVVIGTESYTLREAHEAHWGTPGAQTTPPG